MHPALLLCSPPPVMLLSLLPSCRADYRVPVVLRELGVLRYDPALSEAIDGRQELAAGSQEEVEIRASTVEAVERLRRAVHSRLAGDDRQAELANRLNSVLLDWWLWEQGEAQRKSHRPHHRVRTIYY